MILFVYSVTSLLPSHGHTQDWLFHIGQQSAREKKIFANETHIKAICYGHNFQLNIKHLLATHRYMQFIIHYSSFSSPPRHIKYFPSDLFRQSSLQFHQTSFFLNFSFPVKTRHHVQLISNKCRS